MRIAGRAWGRGYIISVFLATDSYVSLWFSPSLNLWFSPHYAGEIVYYATRRHAGGVIELQLTRGLDPKKRKCANTRAQ